MNDEILFTERQRFRPWWLWLILLGVNGLFLFGVYKQVFIGQQFGDKPMSNTGLLAATGLTIALTLFIVNFRLDTIIRKDGIYVRLFPFQLKFKQYTWDHLSKLYLRQYASIREFGGWGLRFGGSKKGTAFIFGGENGLQLEFKDNKKLLIGTNKPEMLTGILNNLGQLKQDSKPNHD